MDLRVLVAVYETQSFSQAARRLSISPSSVSRHIEKLEAGIGAKLVQRTTRSLAVTEAGHLFYRRSCEVLSTLELAESEAADHSKSAQGHVRAAVPPAIATHKLGSRLGDFMIRYPDLTIDLTLTCEKLDMIRNSIDVMLFASNEIGINATPGFTASPLATIETGIFASPAYLRRRGPTLTAVDLVDHNCLCGRTDMLNNAWPIVDGTTCRFVRVGGTLVTDSGDILLQAVLSGIGIALLPKYLAMHHCQQAELVELLIGQVAQIHTIHAIVPDRKLLPRASRLFIEFARECVTFE